MKTVQIAGFTEPNKYLGTDSLGNLVLKDGGGGGGGTDIVSLQGYMTSSATLYPNNPPVSGQMGVGSGALGAIQKGNAWWVKEANTIIDGKKVVIGTLLIALIDSPSVAADWLLQEDITANFELLANKSNDFVGDQASTTKYPNVKTVWDYIQGVISSITSALGLKENLSNKSTDGTLSSNSDTLYPSQRAAKTYIDNLGNTLTSGLATKLTIANNLSDLTNTTQARDNLLLGATNDVTHNSITLSNITVLTLPFIDTAKKIISATGASLGTWFQTLTADTNPVDADTIVINDSTVSFESKKTTLLQLWSNYILGKVQALGYLVVSGLNNNYVSKWNGSAFVDSLLLSTSSGVGINTSSINASAAFQVDSTTKGVLFPRMNTTQRNAIVSPAQSLLVFDTTINRYFYRHGGGFWQAVGDVDTTTDQQITGNKQFANFSLDFINLGASLPSLTNTYNARYVPLWSNSNTILSLYSNLGGGVYVTMNSQVGTSWYRQHASGTFLTYPCGTQIGNGTAPIYSSVNPTTGSAYEITITPDAGGSLGSMYCIAIIDANNVVTNLIKVKPSLNPTSYDLNIVSNKLQTSGSNASNVVFRGITGFRGGQTNLAQAFWRYSADLSSASIGGNAPNSNASLHLQSTSKGFLPNVLTTAQRDAVSWVAGDAGMIIYNSTTNKHQGWNGTTWNDMY